MAEGTRWKVTEDKLTRHEEILIDLLSSQQEALYTQVGIQRTLELILDRLGALEKVLAGPNIGGGLLPNQAQDNRNRPQQPPIQPPKWELPSFEGEEPKSLVLSRGLLTWVEFKEELISHFGDILVEDVVEEFNKLSQVGSVDEFLVRFEDLKAQMLIRNPALNETHFLSSFIGALKKEIRFAVKLFKPTTLKIAIEKARMQELAIEAAQRRNKTSTRSAQPVTNTIVNRGPANAAAKNTTFRLSPEVYEYRKTNHLCFKCGEKYGLGHEIQQVVCLNALTGHNQGENTILVGGTVKKRQLSILIDSGSTHSFIDEHTIQATGHQSSHCPPVRVTVADGNYVMCTSHCKGNLWKMQGQTFMHNPTTFDHEKRCVIIGRKPNKLVLPALVEGSLKMLSSGSMSRILKKGNALIAHLFMMSMMPNASEDPPDAAVQEVIDQYVEVFAEPKSLLPMRSLDHAIPLKLGAMPVSLRPYRYNYNQKDELEKQVNEMLTSGVIQPSQSAFSSPALLVKKKDGTWRFCVAYRGLNDITIKDKYPIPIVDDLLDELCGAIIFSKVDLRAGYHQIRMKREDVFKTTFRTHAGHYEFRVMPFVFFDDILVYSLTIHDHVQHLKVVFEILKRHSLYAKRTKCSFGQPQVEYLGHVISWEGVATDPQKIRAMVEWPRPKTLKALRGFLGLSGYYRKYVVNYGTISRLLTDLLKKDVFKWNPEAGLAFESLKTTMSTTPVLALSDYSHEFVVETDASHGGIGAVLMQKGRPIAYFSKVLAPKHRGKSIYEKEYMALLSAVDRWRHYLQFKHFVVWTDHHRLKYLLEQKVTSAIQQKGLTKLLGLDYEVQYKRGAENRVTDALSRHQEGLDSLDDQATGNLMAISSCTPTWVREIIGSYVEDARVWDILTLLLTLLAVDSHGPNLWHYSAGILRKKGKVYVGSHGTLRQQLISSFHDTPIGGHSGQLGTLKRLSQLFYWPKMKLMVNDYVSSCDVCHKNKDDDAAYPGLLQPLPVPNQAWFHTNMDFVEVLPKSKSKDVILVVVDRFTKYAHFIALSHLYTAATIASVFWKRIHSLHGTSESIVTDRDKVFLSNFWRALFNLLGTQLNYSSAYHSKSDGQIKRVNRCLENYLRCMVASRPNQWKQWLSAAEWWYNTNFHTVLKCTPFKDLYGYTPPQLCIRLLLENVVQAAEDVIRQRQQFLQLLKDNLHAAQARMKFFVDNKRTDREFAVGDSVYLKIGNIAYKLVLPPESKCHPVFHVSLLKRKVGNRVVVQSSLPNTGADSQFIVRSVAILQRQMVKQNNVAAVKVLVQWSNFLLKMLHGRNTNTYTSPSLILVLILEDKDHLKMEGML
ncbi:hypothetical protein KY285_023835 [Solanum tuberosum]|nr:hypothetical protein KY289_025764 [Solanum tuberosum]KAH0676034.1 hypothetical protein KY285_023835 [Solanum tuberosum]